MHASAYALALLVLAPPAAAQWSSQQDARIFPSPNDLSANEDFGRALDLEGDLLVVGAPLHDPAGLGGAWGAVYVFRRVAGSWVQEAKLTPASHAAGDHFGACVSVRGERIAVGAPEDDQPGATNAGAVYLFERVAGAWVESARIAALDASTFDHFGSALELDGDTLAVGAEFDNAGGGAFSGSAYVFRELGGLWSQEAKLIVPGVTPNALAGSAIALDGDRVVVGAPLQNTALGTKVGAAWLFERSAGVWGAPLQLLPLDPAAGDEFGSAVAVDGDTVLVGAPRKDVVWSSDGVAYVFVGGGSTWTQQARLEDLGPHFNDNFGHALDLQGELAVVGLPFSDAAGVTTGGVQLFLRESGTWTGLFEMVGSDSEGLDYLGSSVAISGNRVAGGAPGAETPPSGANTGEAYVFTIVPPPFVVTYCTAKTNSQGCTPKIGSTGAPSASNPNPFWVTCDDVLGFVFGLGFYGTAPNATPFLGGTLCIGGAIQRTVVQHSGGNPPSGADCSGGFALDMNAVIQTGQDPALVAGAHVFVQYWSRDPGDAWTVSLSDALEFEIVP